MEEFKKKIRRRQLIFNMICLSSLAVYFGLQFLTKDVSDFARGLTMGVWCGVEFVAMFNSIRLLIILKNEEKLKELYIQEHDERNIAIQKETSQKGFFITMMAMAIAAIVAGFFNVTVCTTLFFTMTGSAIIVIAVNLYYRNKM